MYGNSNLTINDGDFLSEPNSALHIVGNGNIKINKGIFNSNRTDLLTDAVIQHSGSGTITIGNFGDNNNNILINNNANNKICGIQVYSEGNPILIVNSGIINGYNGVGVFRADKGLNFHLNGGIIAGIGEITNNDTGWSCLFSNQNLLANLYLKKNANISLSGRGQTGKDSINYQKYITEVD